jgi:hypothetical protein
LLKRPFDKLRAGFDKLRAGFGRLRVCRVLGERLDQNFEIKKRFRNNFLGATFNAERY